jgi:ABC-type transport system involved in multi-copper enzyme maturation permease subunit
MALLVISIFGVNYIASEIIDSSKGGPSSFITESPNVWAIISYYISSYLLVLPCFVIIMHTCAEYTYRTNRQNVIDGLSRTQYITTKILLIVALALFTTIIAFISAFVTRMSPGAVSSENLKFLFYFFMQTVAYLGVAFLFALLLRKAVLSVGLFFVYSLIIENILENYLNKISAGGWIEKIGGFLPISSSEHLLMPNQLKTLRQMLDINDPHSEYAYLAATVVYIVLCYLVCYYRYNKQDL